MNQMLKLALKIFILVYLINIMFIYLKNASHKEMATDSVREVEKNSEREIENDSDEKEMEDDSDRETTIESATTSKPVTTSNSTQPINLSITLPNIEKTSRFGDRCDPINHSYVPYSAIFDGVKYPKSISLFKNFSINFECLQKSNVTKRILGWNAFFGDKTFASPLDSNCPVRNCIFTTDRNELSKADLVIVHMIDPIDDVPANRPSFQRWVFLLFESPYFLDVLAHASKSETKRKYKINIIYIKIITRF